MHPSNDDHVPTPFTPPQSPSVSDSPRDSVTKVEMWMGGQYRPTSPKPTWAAGPTKKPSLLSSPSSPPSTPETKKVHWSPDVRQNKRDKSRKSAARRKPGPQTGTFHTMAQAWYPPVPEPPTPHRPPPAPRPRRLPTPNLDDMGHGPFCMCCAEDTTTKMSCQLAAAAAYMVATRHSGLQVPAVDNSSKRK